MTDTPRMPVEVGTQLYALAGRWRWDYDLALIVRVVASVSPKRVKWTRPVDPDASRLDRYSPNVERLSAHEADGAVVAEEGRRFYVSEQAAKDAVVKRRRDAVERAEAELAAAKERLADANAWEVTT